VLLAVIRPVRPEAMPGTGLWPLVLAVKGRPSRGHFSVRTGRTAGPGRARPSPRVGGGESETRVVPYLRSRGGYAVASVVLMGATAYPNYVQ